MKSNCTIMKIDGDNDSIQNIIFMEQHTSSPKCDVVWSSLFFLILCFLSSQLLLRFEVFVLTLFFFRRALLNKSFGGTTSVGLVPGNRSVLVHAFIFSSIYLSRMSSVLSTNTTHSGKLDVRSTKL
jgi:uncharacterized membrane protein (DUF485 family)